MLSPRSWWQVYCSRTTNKLKTLDMDVRVPRNTWMAGSRRRRGLARVQARRDRGQSLVELAFVVPLLLLLLVGIVEIGRFAFYSIVVSNAARAGAQYGAQSLANAADTAGIATAAKNDGQGGTGLTITSNQLCGCSGATLSGACPATLCALPNHALVYVQVQVVGAFPSLFRYPGLPASISVTSVEEMRVAQ
jgi:Flp pilus assembly protein TadG